MEIRTNEPMARHTSFRVGGLADRFMIPESEGELREAVLDCKASGKPWYMVGNGSNLLVGDKGFRGTIISTERLTELEVYKNENSIIAGAGVMLSKLANTAAREQLTGLEFAAGIPGTVGGAVMMNAGAYGSEMKNVLLWADVMDRYGTVKRLKNEELELGYRTSALERRGLFAVRAAFSLTTGDPGAIREKMEELAAKRKEKQPLEYPSAGSTFKRPEGYFAGKLIEDAGLKGFSVGGAAVSEKHAGFVINKDHGTAADILELCNEVKRRVKENSGVDLEMEVKLLGDF